MKLCKDPGLGFRVSPYFLRWIPELEGSGDEGRRPGASNAGMRLGV